MLQNLLSDDEQAQEADHDQESVTLESDHFDGTCEDVIGKGNTLRKRKVGELYKKSGVVINISTGVIRYLP